MFVLKCILTIAGVVLLLKSYKQVLVKTGHIIGMLLSLIVSVASSVGMAAVMFISAIGGEYSATAYHFISYIAETFNQHIISGIFIYDTDCLFKKIIFILKKSVLTGARTAVAAVSYFIKSDQTQSFVFPLTNTVLLQ